MVICRLSLSFESIKTHKKILHIIISTKRKKRNGKNFLPTPTFEIAASPRCRRPDQVSGGASNPIEGKTGGGKGKNLYFFEKCCIPPS